MSSRDMPSFGEFDLAVVNALKKNPQGLRYKDLYRKSGKEYDAQQPGLRRRTDTRSEKEGENRLNIKTFDKHLKRLVAEGVLERIEEKRFRVFYKLMIPEDSFPKRYVADVRKWYIPVIVSFAKNMRESGKISEPLVEGLIEDFVPHLVKDSLVKAISLYKRNPSWARYLVDESIELTRRLVNDVAMILSNDEETSEKVTQTFYRIEGKRSRRTQAQLRKMRQANQSVRALTMLIHDYTIDLSKIEEEGDFDCPRCKAHIFPDDETGKGFSIVNVELGSEQNERPGLTALVIKCHKCGAIIRLEGFY